MYAFLENRDYAGTLENYNSKNIFFKRCKYQNKLFECSSFDNEDIRLGCEICFLNDSNRYVQIINEFETSICNT